ESGFDPRRDVREFLYVSTPAGSVVLARGVFPVQTAPRGAKSLRHGDYTIWASERDAGRSGFCVLDQTLAAAGEGRAIEAALDQWKARTVAIEPLISRAAPVKATSQLWGVTTGSADLFTGELPKGVSAFDLSSVLRGLSEMWFEADLNSGLHLEVHGTE